MIKSITFEHFRNLNGTYYFNNNLNIIFGKNNSGKSNILDGIRLAFSGITNEYFKVKKSDFNDSNDDNPITIKVILSENTIESLSCYDENRNLCYGFILIVKKLSNGKYIKKITLLNECSIDFDILREDENIPNIYSIPLIRIDDIYTDWLSTGISKFIESNEKYNELKNQSKKDILSSMDNKINEFQSFCSKFNQNMKIELSEPKISDEKVYIVDGDKEHNYCIGSGYKSIANIILNLMEENYNIILIDEIENHLHPSLLRTLIREIRSLNKKSQIIATTHSPIVVNELLNDELMDVSGKKLDSTDQNNRKKLEKFLHPGRSEIVFADNIVLVEGYTEEMLLKHYLSFNENYNFTVVNVAGIMFEPYIDLCKLLNKKTVVISDTDIALSEKLEASSRFQNLKKLCTDKGIKLLEVYNTLESDLYINGFLNNLQNMLICIDKMNNLYVAKNGKKTLIAESIINQNIDLSNWHIIKDIKNEFTSN